MVGDAPMHILVVGGNGFIGLVVARRMRALDHHVTPLDAGIAAFIVMAHRTRIPALCPYRSVLGADDLASDQNARYGAAIGRSGGSFAASLLSLL